MKYAYPLCLYLFLCLVFTLPRVFNHFNRDKTCAYISKRFEYIFVPSIPMCYAWVWVFEDLEFKGETK